MTQPTVTKAGEKESGVLLLHKGPEFTYVLRMRNVGFQKSILFQPMSGEKANSNYCKIFYFYFNFNKLIFCYSISHVQITFLNYTYFFKRYIYIFYEVKAKQEYFVWNLGSNSI